MVNRVVLPLSAVVVLLVGIWLGGHPETLPGFLRDPLVGDEQTQILNEALGEVEDRYFRKIPENELADRSIQGLVKSLNDPFSTYFTPKQFKEFTDRQNSEFSGIGVTVSQDPKGLKVVQVFKDSPAKAAGILKDDLIVGAAGKPLKGLTQDRSTDLIRGPIGTQVKLVIERDGKERRLDVGRATINVPVVASKLVERKGRKVGVVRLAQFSSGAHAEVYEALRKMEKQGAKSFVLDLRANGGGLVTEARLVASAFLPDGKIVTTRGRSVDEQTFNATGRPVIPASAGLSVLVDRDSASASEIVAGALQDRKRAKLVGTRTYGKGVFQQVIEMSNGGALDITAGQYFTPSGRNLGGEGTARGKGLAPDVKVQDDPKTERTDEAVEKAVEVASAGAS